MGRRSSSQPLAIWANGEQVGRWTPTTRRPMDLRYADSWLASSAARPLSLSLPLPLVGNEPLRGERVQSFFDNLLPDSAAIRRRLAQRYAAGSDDTFDLLAAIGRDCVGAVQLLPEDEAPTGFDRIEGQALDDEGVAAVLRATVASGGLAGRGEDQNFRISIAG
ncbi:MAG: HipA N-terminal domain-containing protein, partial [Serpentinimonas sp.]|nr:HipA N-terminal domain-containing protein [Serpentinimonas sp.]